MTQLNEVTCDFCEEFASGICAHWPELGRRILYEDEDFCVFPGLGAFVKGYLLICSKAHVPSFAYLDEERIRRFQLVLSKTVGALTEAYRVPWLFEHGATYSRGRAGGCTEHAHVHLLPASANLDKVVQEKFQSVALSDWTELSKWKDSPYLLVQTPTGDLLVSAVSENLPSQYLRRVAADAVGRSEEWNWAVSFGEENILSTLNRLTSAFS